MIAATSWGLGVHQYDVRLTDLLPHFVKFSYIGLVVQSVWPYIIKLSILALYLRIFSSSFGNRWAIRAVLVFVSLWTVYSFLQTLLLCIPIAKAWDLSMRGGRCLVVKWPSILNGAMNAATDLLVLVLPIPMVMRLQMGTRQKTGMLAIVLMGSFATIASFVRFGIFVDQTLWRPDVTWTVTPTIVWCTVEGNLGIICACIVVLKPFVRHVFPTLFATSSAPASDGRTPSHGSSSRSGGSHRSGSFFNSLFKRRRYNSCNNSGNHITREKPITPPFARHPHPHPYPYEPALPLSSSPLPEGSKQETTITTITTSTTPSTTPAKPGHRHHRPHGPRRPDPSPDARFAQGVYLDLGPSRPPSARTASSVSVSASASASAYSVDEVTAVESSMGSRVHSPTSGDAAGGAGGGGGGGATQAKNIATPDESDTQRGRL
ncbi:MAG: hypothetical protein M1826_001664 [Phylliscum demangeonii]|nr:MAG: hypothetical protein M1826_001664 [Phylliscum demangeonii]